MIRAVGVPGRIQRVAAALERDRELRRRVTSESKLLRPGLYVRDGETLWRRAGSRTTEHVTRTKAARAGGLGPVRTATSWFVVGPRSHGTADSVVAAFDGGVVVFDQYRGLVYRSYGTGSVSTQYIAWRQSFTRHVSAPSFSVSRDHAVITEELVEGRHILDVEPKTQLSVLRCLMAQYASLARAEGVAGDPMVGARLRHALDGISLPPAFREQYTKCEVDWLDHPTTWVPSAFEATTKNLMVRPDGRPAPIDLGDLRPDACFVYPIGVLTSVGGELLGRYLAGELDDAVADLMAVAGQEWRATPSARVGLLLLRLAYAAFCDAASDGNFETELFASSLWRRWAELSVALN